MSLKTWLPDLKVVKTTNGHILGSWFIFSQTFAFELCARTHSHNNTCNLNIKKEARYRSTSTKSSCCAPPFSASTIMLTSFFKHLCYFSKKANKNFPLVFLLSQFFYCCFHVWLSKSFKRCFLVQFLLSLLMRTLKTELKVT